MGCIGGSYRRNHTLEISNARNTVIMQAYSVTRCRVNSAWAADPEILIAFYRRFLPTLIVVVSFLVYNARPRIYFSRTNFPRHTGRLSARAKRRRGPRSIKQLIVKLNLVTSRQWCWLLSKSGYTAHFPFFYGDENRAVTHCAPKSIAIFGLKFPHPREWQLQRPRKETGDTICA